MRDFLSVHILVAHECPGLHIVRDLFKHSSTQLAKHAELFHELDFLLHCFLLNAADDEVVVFTMQGGESAVFCAQDCGNPSLIRDHCAFPEGGTSCHFCNRFKQRHAHHLCMGWIQKELHSFVDARSSFKKSTVQCSDSSLLVEDLVYDLDTMVFKLL
jgi:hypothetical protein